MTRRARAVTIDGADYPSIAAAAEALCLSRGAIYERLWTRGHANTMPIGRPRSSTPVTVDGVAYDNIHVASVLLGLSRHALAWRMQTYGTYDTPPNSPRNPNKPRRIPMR